MSARKKISTKYKWETPWNRKTGLCSQQSAIEWWTGDVVLQKDGLPSCKAVALTIIVKDDELVLERGLRALWIKWKTICNQLQNIEMKGLNRKRLIS